MQLAGRCLSFASSLEPGRFGALFALHSPARLFFPLPDSREQIARNAGFLPNGVECAYVGTITCMKTRCLLYVDDSKDLADLVKMFFEQRYPACEVLLAFSVDDALQVLRGRHGMSPFPQAIAVDANLTKKEDGVNLVKTVRAEFPRLRTVLVSGAPRHLEMGMPAHAFAVKDGDAMGFVEKLFQLIQCPTDLLPAVK